MSSSLDVGHFRVRQAQKQPKCASPKGHRMKRVVGGPSWMDCCERKGCSHTEYGK